MINKSVHHLWKNTVVANFQKDPMSILGREGNNSCNKSNKRKLVIQPKSFEVSEI